MLKGKHTSDIIAKFETYVSDQTELSDQDELELADKIYREVLDDRDWVFLHKPATGSSISSDANGYYVALPSDFNRVAVNNLTTDNSVAIINNAEPKVLFVGTSTRAWTPYQFVNYADRRQYHDQDGYVYVDPVQNQVRFTNRVGQASGIMLADPTWEFDYIYDPPSLTAAATAPYSDPVFPEKFWDQIYHGMAVDNEIAQLFDRSHSYMKEHTAKRAENFAAMCMWDANMQMQ